MVKSVSGRLQRQRLLMTMIDRMVSTAIAPKTEMP